MQNAAHAAEAANITIGEIIDAYIREKENKFADKVCRSPETIRQHLKAVRALWGAMTLAEFSKRSKARVKEQVEAWRAEGLKPNTCRARIAKLRTAINFAFEEELIAEAVKPPVFKLPAAGAPRSRFVDPERELPLIFARLNQPDIKPHVRLAVPLLFTTGQRRGALADLKWAHCDFERRTINFKDTQSPEMRTSKRRTNLPMSDFLYGLLWEAKQRATCEYVIEWRGKQVKDIYYSVKRVLKLCGLGDVVLHDFRRSSATYVHSKLEDMESAADHLGDSVAMTKRVYVQRDISGLVKGIEAASDVVSAAAQQAGGDDHPKPAPRAPPSPPRLRAFQGARQRLRRRHAHAGAA